MRLRLRSLLALLLLLLGFSLAQMSAPATPPTPAAQRAADQGVQDWLAGKYRVTQDTVRELSKAQNLPQLLKEYQRLNSFQPVPPGATTNLGLRRFLGRQAGAEVYGYPISVRGQMYDVQVAVAPGAGGTWAVQSARLDTRLLPDWLHSPAAVTVFTLLSLGLVAAAFVRGGFRLWLERALAIAREQRVLFIVLNAVLYGLFALGCAIGAALPQLSQVMGELLGGSLSTTGIQHFQSNVPTLATGIATWNFSSGVVATTYLPGLFFGVPALLINLSRLFLTGVALAPGAAVPIKVFLLHLPTILIELQAYIFVAVSAIAWLVRWARIGFLRAWRDFGYSLAPALLLIVVAAWYEAFEVLVLVPLVK